MPDPLLSNLSDMMAQWTLQTEGYWWPVLIISSILMIAAPAAVSCAMVFWQDAKERKQARPGKPLIHSIRSTGRPADEVGADQPVEEKRKAA